MLKLTVYQLMKFGVHIGHDKKNSVFFVSWIFYGWRDKVFMINLIKTVMYLKIALNILDYAICNKRSIWYVNLSKIFSDYVIRYGYICGEAFCNYWWINGSLTNFKLVFGWNNFLIKLLLANKILKDSHKKQLLGFIGFLNKRKRRPLVGFVTNVLDSYFVAEEFMVCKIPCIGIIDSNVKSWNVSLPVPGNDDSFLCINFYCYFITRFILLKKMYFLVKWKNLVRIKKKKLNLKFLFLLNLKRRYFFKSKVFLIKKFKVKTIKEKPLTLILKNHLVTDFFSIFRSNKVFFSV